MYKHTQLKNIFCKWSRSAGDLLLRAVDELVLVGPLVARSHTIVMPQRLSVVVKLL